MRKQLESCPFNREKPLQSLFWRSASLLLGRACQRFWASSPRLKRLQLSCRLAASVGCGEEFWSVKSTSGGAGEGGHTPHEVLKSHSECIRREHEVGSNSCCLSEIGLLKTIFPLK